MKVKLTLIKAGLKPETTNGFTIGKTYEAVRKEGRGLIVINDNGHERFILLGCRSPHVKTKGIDLGVGPMEKSIGVFNTVEGNNEEAAHTLD